MDDPILQRIRRIYDSIGAIEEHDLSNLGASIVQNERVKGVFQDFRGGLSDGEISNYAHMTIHNVANLQDNLKRWAANNGRDKTKVDKAVNDSLDLQIVKDLSNNDKHGYPPRDRGHSGKSPRLVDINRVMVLKTKAKKGSTIVMTLDTQGIPKTAGDGTAKAIITGDVVDSDGNRIGDLHKIIGRAIEAWENLLNDLGLGIDPDMK